MLVGAAHLTGNSIRRNSAGFIRTMRAYATPFLFFAMLVMGRGWAAEKVAPAVKDPAFSLPAVESQSAAPKFTESQMAFVLGWIKQAVPECPAAISMTVAEAFLEDLQQQHPDKLEQLGTRDFPAAAFESTLLQQVGVKLNGAAQGALREETARRRVGAVLTAGGRDSQKARADAAGLVVKLKDASPPQYRRLVEGKMDDDDLELLLKKSSQSAAAPIVAIPVKPKVLTASDIVSEYARRNQTGSALQHLRAYAVQGKLKTATGEEQELLLFKLRPDRFRMVVRSAGLTRLILASDGTRFWQQAPGQPAQVVPAKEMGSRIYLAEFADPLFVGEGYTFDRRDDGTTEGREFYRIGVRRPDGSGYVACIDTETFRETARESDDRSVTRYSDFREVGGVTYAFREEIADTAGHKVVFTLSSLAPNPGLIQDFFELPSAQNTNYFKLEQLMAAASVGTGK